MRRAIRALVAALALAVPGAAATAAPPVVPGGMSYQGVLLDDQGAPRTGTVDLTLRIYDAISGGTLLYVQTLLSVPLDDGVFSVELGPTGAASDTPVDPLTTSLEAALAGDLGATGPSRFLEVTVGATGPLTRTQILTVPYATRAGSAATADVATTAQSAQNAVTVNGLDSAILVSVWEDTNLDFSGPNNADPEEGIGDTDLDGVPNFVDPDNDGDGLSDGVEVSQGTAINLVTPTASGVAPPSGPNLLPVPVSIQGMGFEPGASVTFGSDPLTPTLVTPTRIDVVVDPQAPGSVDVAVSNPNGESGLLSAGYTFVAPVHSTDLGPLTKLAFDVTGSARTVVGGRNEYQVDLDGDALPETTVGFATAGGAAGSNAGQLAVAWSPSGELVGLRCRETGGSECDVEVSRDSDSDGDLGDETAAVVETLSAAVRRVFAPGIAFDAAGRIVASYVAVENTVDEVVVLHDTNGDDQFTGPGERVVVESPFFSFEEFVGDLAVDSSGRVAYVYYVVTQAIRLAFDQNGDGDFADPGELFDVQTLATSPECLGLGFAPDGDLAIVWAESGQAPTFARDLNGDGDFADGGEVTTVGASAAAHCDLEGGGPLALAHDGGGLRLLVDDNDDGDFADAGEDAAVASDGTTEALELARDDVGRIWLATENEILIDPGVF